jgi:hypothetical protein
MYRLRCWRRYPARWLKRYRFWLVSEGPDLNFVRDTDSVCVWWRAPQQMLRTHRSLEAYCATLWWRWLIFFFVFSYNEAAMQWNWQWKPEVLGEKPVPVPLCPPQVPHGLIRDRTQAFAVRGRRLTYSLPSTRFAPLRAIIKQYQ